MKDLYNNIKVVQLYPVTAWSGDAYTYYIDTKDLLAVDFLVVGTMSTADGSNYCTPKLYGTNSATPATFTNYTVCTDDEVDNSQNAAYAYMELMDSTAAFTSEMGLKQHLYRYYCIFLDEESTAIGNIGVYAIVQPEKQPASSYTATTGAVS